MENINIFYQIQHQLDDAIKKSHNEHALILIDQQLNLFKDDAFKFVALMNQALVYIKQRNASVAKGVLTQCKKIAQACFNNNQYLGKVYFMLGQVCNMENALEESTEYYKKVIIIYTKLKIPEMIVMANVNMANNYYQSNDYRMAVECLNAAMNSCELLQNDTQRQQYHDLINFRLGLLHQLLGKPIMSSQYFKQVTSNFQYYNKAQQKIAEFSSKHTQYISETITATTSLGIQSTLYPEIV